MNKTFLMKTNITLLCVVISAAAFAVWLSIQDSRAERFEHDARIIRTALIQDFITSDRTPAGWSLQTDGSQWRAVRPSGDPLLQQYESRADAIKQAWAQAIFEHKLTASRWRAAQ